jgi:hypothetical protein
MSSSFDQSAFQQKILEFITTARLPFRIIEHASFRSLLDYARIADSKLNIPSARTIRRLLDTSVEVQQREILNKLPDGCRISIALDCWTSPFKQAFMAITGYFIDQDWNYHEVLLGFEHLYGSHTGSNLSNTVIQILQHYKIADRVLSITTDNATNNNTMMIGIQETVQSLLQSGSSIFRVPCIAHVIQLCLQELLGKLKAVPENDEAESEWSSKRNLDLQTKCSTRSIVNTLKKVSSILFPFNEFN